MANEQNLRPVRTSEEARIRGHNGGIKSGQVRRAKSFLRKLGYTGIMSFDKLEELQKIAIANNNLGAALKAEELKGRLAGLYIEKVANTNSEGEDVVKNDLSGLSMEALLKLAERVDEKIDEQ